MIVKSFVNNAFQETTYLLIDQDTRQCVVIDPGMSNDREWAVVQSFLDAERLTPSEVWLTHAHVDHMMGTGYLSERYGLTIAGPIGDFEQLPTALMQSQLFGISLSKDVAPLTRNIVEGDHLKVGNLEVEVLDVPGHSFHGLCYYVPNEKVLFSGDVLFYCSVGRSDFGPRMGGNGELLIEGIRSKLMSLPPDIQVYPGHGPSTTIQNEITYNPYF